jgi:hypothetical protein
MIIAFLIGNILYIIIKVKNVPGLTRRFKLIFIIILIPLLLKGNINLIANHYKISLDVYARIY